MDKWMGRGGGGLAGARSWGRVEEEVAMPQAGGRILMKVANN
jgi:hypothetical protein